MQKIILITGQGKIIIKPQLSFDDLAGNLKSKVSLTDEELRQARDSFSQKWARRLL